MNERYNEALRRYAKVQNELEQWETQRQAKLAALRKLQVRANRLLALTGGLAFIAVRVAHYWTHPQAPYEWWVGAIDVIMLSVIAGVPLLIAWKVGKG